MQLGYPILSILTLLPIAGMIITAFVPKENVKMIRGITVAVTGLQIVFAIILWANFNGSMAGINDAKGFQFVERNDWIRNLRACGFFCVFRVFFLYCLC